ncbi:hypothetical protein M9H77_12667 [Catharanthus roseus]|uniref:Uncharacterized protein n=1 Tax=Catharanthus roseus TaxID=4058 RepID=A0ACC0BI69_CATRO|nr:hypothetical protein M9H77_12667 [Catharanthus roseus]
MVFHYLDNLEIMPPRNSDNSTRSSRATADLSNNKLVLPLPYRISDEANRMRATGWDLFVTMTGDYYPNVVREFYANIFFKSDPYNTDITTSVKGAQAVGKKVVKSNGLERTWKVAFFLIGRNIASRSSNQTNDLRMIGCSPMPDRVNYEKSPPLRT